MPQLALIHAAWSCAIVAAVCWLLSVVTRHYGFVDRLWSLLPPCWVAYFAWQTRFHDARLAIMTALVVLWSARLTFNFVRRGGYQPSYEDYRWAEVRQRMHPALFQVFNLLFIAAFQIFLLGLLATPAWIALSSRAPLGPIDYAAAGAFVLFFVGEAIADQQQHAFQTEKYARKARGETVEVEFCTTGLFRFSRHPNFFCEQAMWWSFYAFTIGAGAPIVNWTIAGPALLSILFQGSTTVTERITLRKYPSYARYQRMTSRLVPLPPRNA